MRHDLLSKPRLRSFTGRRAFLWRALGATVVFVPLLLLVHSEVLRGLCEAYWHRGWFERIRRSPELQRDFLASLGAGLK